MVQKTQDLNSRVTRHTARRILSPQSHSLIDGQARTAGASVFPGALVRRYTEDGP
jgi:hypothetical protein